MRAFCKIPINSKISDWGLAARKMALTAGRFTFSLIYLAPLLICAVLREVKTRAPLALTHDFQPPSKLERV